MHDHFIQIRRIKAYSDLLFFFSTVTNLETHLVGPLTEAIMLVSTIASSSCLTGPCSDMGSSRGGCTTGNT